MGIRVGSTLKLSLLSSHLRLEYQFYGFLREAGLSSFSLPQQSYCELAVGHHRGSTCSKEFVKSSSVGNKSFIVQHSANKFGRFLAVAEYGGGQRGLVVILKHRGGSGWLGFSLELHKFLDFFQPPFSDRKRATCKGSSLWVPIV
jgi:hypothetical protein